MMISWHNATQNLRFSWIFRLCRRQKVLSWCYFLCASYSDQPKAYKNSIKKKSLRFFGLIFFYASSRQVDMNIEIVCNRQRFFIISNFKNKPILLHNYNIMTTSFPIKIVSNSNKFSRKMFVKCLARFFWTINKYWLSRSAVMQSHSWQW